MYINLRFLFIGCYLFLLTLAFQEKIFQILICQLKEKRGRFPQRNSLNMTVCCCNWNKLFPLHPHPPSTPKDWNPLAENKKQRFPTDLILLREGRVEESKQSRTAKHSLSSHLKTNTNPLVARKHYSVCKFLRMSTLLWTACRKYINKCFDAKINIFFPFFKKPFLCSIWYCSILCSWGCVLCNRRKANFSMKRQNWKRVNVYFGWHTSPNCCQTQAMKK